MLCYVSQSLNASDCLKRVQVEEVKGQGDIEILLAISVKKVVRSSSTPLMQTKAAQLCDFRRFEKMLKYVIAVTRKGLFCNVREQFTQIPSRFIQK
ncbi:hypothetical protein RO3G_16211 [Rhizopus delemar RA 99-880]|uniref:Uncharacterized protein n=1 Tax=Rhizopus delemar (strain RA 99-880 / ATCC MYA-4621 / FGSC 9543 / NRRL 43880) TaxID=246409 RepID=I1CSS0_RHIO9|nr:hypothetical protein RO3G_16211 [Rhizopus delemar RA 99-880]|eukprot:EIE91500.1 hypothetical protein RO3G_16211 [Rhizopus delemar RA 99-880]